MSVGNFLPTFGARLSVHLQVSRINGPWRWARRSNM